MGPTWKRNVYGTPGSDSVSYNFQGVSKGDLVGSAKWADLKSKIEAERSRWGLETKDIFEASPQTKIIAEGLNNLKNNIPVQDLQDIEPKSDLSSGSFNKVVNALNNSGETCNCNCAYCTCNCNYCICNCDYACTCNCAYCTCACNYCTCNCNWSCPCNCAY